MIGRKNGIVTDNNWKKLENELYKDMKERNPEYNFETQKTYKGHGKRPDVYGQHKDVSYLRKVGEAKCVKELTLGHVQQAKGYKKHPGYVKDGTIGVCRDTKVPHEVRRQAKENGFEVRRLDVGLKKSWYQR